MFATSVAFSFGNFTIFRPPLPVLRRGYAGTRALGYQERFKTGKAERLDRIEHFTCVLRTRSREVWRKSTLGERDHGDPCRASREVIGQMSAKRALTLARRGHGESLAGRRWLGD